ncbi:MAG: DNRLRE domain-containing protein [bacterium]|nr:DNRLRE domain-containing protein [bacterium]
MKYLLIISLVLIIPAIAGTVTLQPGPALGKDAFVFDGLRNNNFGNNADLRVSGLSASSRYLSYIEFDGLDDYAGQGHNVTSAQFSLYLHSGSGTGTINLYIVTSAWNEGTITWNNLPSNESTAYLSESYNSSSGWKNYNVTSAVQNWLDETNPNHGFLIRGNTGETFIAYYRSSDFSNDTYRPKLTVTSPTMAIDSQSLGEIKATFR